MELYIGVSKLFMTLSGGALGLSVVFVEDVLGETLDKPTDFIIMFWIFMCLTIVLNAIYQYLAVKLIEKRFGVAFIIEDAVPDFFRYCPGFVFGLGLICFILGVFFFTAFTIIKLA
jgi:hypothetical protein